MEEKTEWTEAAQPQAEEPVLPPEDETDAPQAEEPVVPIKYNKEVRNLSLKEAGELAQKGLKYSAIEKEYGVLKQLAGKENKSVPQYIRHLQELCREQRLTELAEKCGGNAEMAEHILQLETETGAEDDGFGELKANVPSVSSLEDIPEQVLENARVKGTLLFDEYLRYRFAEEQRKKQATEKQNLADRASTGSLQSRNGLASNETEAFLKGLWK